MTFYPEDGDLSRRVAALERQLASLQRTDRLISASVGAGGLSVRDDGTIRSEDFDGDLGTDDPGTTGWAMSKDSAAFATLLLRDQIIGPDSLGLAFVSGDELTNSFDVTKTETLIHTVSLDVPDWATEGIFIASSYCYMENKDTASAFGRLRHWMDVASAPDSYDLVRPGDFANFAVTNTKLVTFFSGTGRTADFEARVKCDAGGGGEFGTGAGYALVTNVLGIMRA